MVKTFSVSVLLLCLGVMAGGQQAGTTEAAREPPREQYPFFTDAENRLILDFYRPGSGHVPPVLKKQEGLAAAALPKPLARGSTLPAALEKAVEPFPKDLDRRLTTVPSGYRRVLYGMTAFLVQDATRLIVDALDLSRR